MESDDEIKGPKNSYDFGNRFYDNRVGRFLSIDKFAEKFAYQSPYIFAGNTPIWAVDSNGDSIRLYTTSEMNAKRLQGELQMELGSDYKVSYEFIDGSRKVMDEKDGRIGYQVGPSYYRFNITRVGTTPNTEKADKLVGLAGNKEDLNLQMGGFESDNFGAVIWKNRTGLNVRQGPEKRFISKIIMEKYGTNAGEFKVWSFNLEVLSKLAQNSSFSAIDVILYESKKFTLSSENGIKAAGRSAYVGGYGFHRYSVALKSGEVGTIQYIGTSDNYFVKNKVYEKKVKAAEKAEKRNNRKKVRKND